ncbi:prepilin-type N-terminal cleavage/methylation domain-containing protein [Thermostichus sp. MS-CIW-19]|uniref:PulJ/GspJ family protein n=1 Tax=unclassified Synechococcus TaxID=2626047 RepID=UPI000C17D520|nr:MULTISPECIES: prepilin-type N-terminal cleavage/methylation domain-containing protein [unclassified Synechococcus]PIK95149.1 type IV pilin [Synechococcus sp. 60AY4M2]PIK97392.1 type IV pilin [Synechococcus sp. 63AY4M1]PIL01887.1 type IV pilin [Synechococcus sp. 65AY640]
MVFKSFRRRASRGFTLIELLVSLLIAFIFLLATGMIVVETMRLDREETGRTQVQAELTQAMEYIQQDLAEALYIYNDTEQNPQQSDRLGDGIPDVIQRLYTPGWIRQPAGAIPVVAFWKLEPIPQGCYEGNPTLQDIRRGNATLPNQPPPEFPLDQNDRNADWDTLVSRRGIYTLVVYYLRRNYNNAGNPTGRTPWEGNARIDRFELRPFNIQGQNNCAGRSPFFVEDPDPFRDGFLAWPSEQARARQIPIAGRADGPRLTTLVSNIFSSREGSPQVAPACPQGYAFGGGKPNGVTFPGLGDNQNDVGFYVCVRQSVGADRPQDVIINITATAMERANPGLFRRYIRNATSVDISEVSRYLLPMQTLVLARGVINRPLS